MTEPRCWCGRECEVRSGDPVGVRDGVTLHTNWYVCPIHGTDWDSETAREEGEG